MQKKTGGGTNRSLTKRLLSIVVSAAMIFGIIGVMPKVDVHAEEIWDGSSDVEWYDGELTEMHISTAEELAGLAKLVNSGKSMTGQTIVLDSDIMLNDISDYTNWSSKSPANRWTCIGDTSSNYFNGTFDGNGHTVSGMYHKYSGDSFLYTGLFGRIGSGATIKNVLIEYGYIYGYRSSGYAYCGGICGYNNGGTISCCVNKGAVEGERSGGICGCAGGEYVIENCYNQGDVYGSNNSGGILGRSDSSGTISNVYNTGTMSGSSSAMGGIIGYYDSLPTMTSCYYLISASAQGIGNYSSDSYTIGKNSAGMKSTSFAKSLGDAFVYNSNGYPMLQCELTNISAKFSTDNITISQCGQKVTLDLITNYPDSPEWFSDNTDVATVEDGVVTAVSNGTATIYAFCGDITAMCTVTVDCSYSLNKSEVTLTAGQSFKLEITTAEGDPIDAKSAVWISSNEKVATVSEDGTITAVADGMAVITVMTDSYDLTCNVTVNKNLSNEPALNYTNSTIEIRNYLKLEVLNYTGTCKWFSSDESVAKVTDSGAVIPYAFGKTTIRAILENGKTLKCEIEVVHSTWADIDQDGYYTINDVNLLQKYLVNEGSLDEYGSVAADINGDGKLNAFDLVCIKRVILIVKESSPN